MSPPLWKLVHACVDFEILAGAAAPGAPALDVSLRWMEDRFCPAEPVRTAIESRVAAFRESLPAQGLVDGLLAGLSGYHLDTAGLTLDVRPAYYSTFAFTNLALDTPLGSGPDSALSIRALAGARLFSLPSPFLANPLNVIAMIVTTDGCTFVPRRSARVYERPHTWQASAGGAVEQGNRSPAEALVREIEEEWGLKIAGEDISFLAFGRNRRTAEPDLLALVRPRVTAAELNGIFRDRCDGFEFREFDVIPLERAHSRHLASLLHAREWSQPSDQAAFLLTLIAEFGYDRVAADVVAELPAASPSNNSAAASGPP